MDNKGPYFYVNSIVKSNQVITAFFAYMLQSKEYAKKSGFSSLKVSIIKFIYYIKDKIHNYWYFDCYDNHIEKVRRKH